MTSRTPRRAGPDEGEAGDVYHRDRVTWVAFGALFAFGLLNALLGPLLPYLRESLHLSYVVSALHQVAYALGGMSAGILATRSRASRRRTILVGLGGAAVAGLGLGFGGTLPVTLLAAAVVSGFGTAATIRVWALLADLHRSRRAVAMTEGEVAVSLAGVMTPLVVGACAATALGWGFSTVIAFVLVVAAAVAVAVTTLPPASEPPPEGSGDDAAQAGTGRTLTAIFAVVGLEFTLSFWAASYLHDDVGLARETSVALVSALYAANLVGRVLASRVARRRPAPTVLLVCLATALAGVPVLLLAQNAVVAVCGLAVVGVGTGGTFPLASALHVEASRRSADQALGQTLAVAGLGQIAGPVAAGAIAQLADLRVGLVVLAALVLLAAAATTRPSGGSARRGPH